MSLDPTNKSKVGPRTVRVDGNIDGDKTPETPSGNNSAGTPDKITEDAVRSFVDGIAANAKSVHYIGREVDYNWDGEKHKVLKHFIDNVLEKNLWFKGMDLARADTAEAVCREIECRKELTCQFAQMVDSRVKQKP